MERALPVRCITQFVIFGMTLEVETYMSEVSKEPIPEDLFVVPAGYTRVDDLATVLGLDDL